MKKREEITKRMKIILEKMKNGKGEGEENGTFL